MLISDEIKHDHRQLERAYRSILDAKTLEDKEAWQNQFTWELACHAVGEELVVYPAFEEYLVYGKDMADRDRVEHKIVKDLLYKFQGLEADDPDFVPTLKSLWKHLERHIQSEEGRDIVELENKLKPAESDRLAMSFSRTKKFTPTRSHPSAPDKPPFETVAGLVTAPLDRLQDLFRKFP